MRVLDASDILELTECGAAASNERRAMMVLEAAYPKSPPETIASASLSSRDRALLAVHARLFGVGIHAQDVCEHCGEVLELSLTADAVGLGATSEPFPEATTGYLANGHRVRAITAGDAALASEETDLERARGVLASRVAPDAGESADLDDVLESLDPAADVEFVLNCPLCGGTGVRSFDVPTFVWQELRACVPRILRDVATLARAFHWSEQDILSMSTDRRACYLAEALS